MDPAGSHAILALRTITGQPLDVGLGAITATFDVRFTDACPARADVRIIYGTLGYTRGRFGPSGLARTLLDPAANPHLRLRVYRARPLRADAWQAAGLLTLRQLTDHVHAHLRPAPPSGGCGAAGLILTVLVNRHDFGLHERPWRIRPMIAIAVHLALRPALD